MGIGDAAASGRAMANTTVEQYYEALRATDTTDNSVVIPELPVLPEEDLYVRILHCYLRQICTNVMETATRFLPITDMVHPI